MKFLPFVALTLLLSAPLRAEPRVNLAEDAASDGAYGSGWNSGSNGGTGFGAWVFQQTQTDGGNSYAGFFVATPAENSLPEKLVTGDKAFGLFANGESFETACAFRAFDKALAAGDSFSFLMATGPFEAKHTTDDPAQGAIGVTVRTGQASASSDDYNAGARFEFGHYEGEEHYRIRDGEADTDSGIPVADSGVTVTITLVTADTYDLEVTTMSDNQTKRFPTRRLSGPEGAPLESFCVFDRDGEKNDAFFNGFQISRPAS